MRWTKKQGKYKNNFKQLIILIIMAIILMGIYAINITVHKSAKAKENIDFKFSIVSLEIAANDKSYISRGDINVSKTNKDTTKDEFYGDYKKVFKQDIFLGHSITKGLASYKFLEDANVCATVGNRTEKVKGEVDKAVKINPKRIFILYG